MAERNTREELLNTALTMFSERGYEAVSIRDISGAVHIKESSVYYHFLNKRAILESILEEFEQKAESLNKMIISGIEQALAGSSDGSAVPEFKTAISDNLPIFKWLANYYCDKFLFDPFCNKVMRVLALEQFHDRELAEAYTRWLFDRPLEIQSEAVRHMGGPEIFATFFNSCLTRLIFRYLLSGELTETNKNLFRSEMASVISDLLKMA